MLFLPSEDIPNPCIWYYCSIQDPLLANGFSSQRDVERAADFGGLGEKAGELDCRHPNEIVEMVYLLALARKPNTAEIRYCKAHMKRRYQFYLEQKRSAEKAHQVLASLRHMLVSSNEVLCGWNERRPNCRPGEQAGR